MKYEYQEVYFQNTKIALYFMLKFRTLYGRVSLKIGQRTRCPFPAFICIEIRCKAGSGQRGRISARLSNKRGFAPIDANARTLVVVLPNQDV